MSCDNGSSSNSLQINQIPPSAKTQQYLTDEERGSINKTDKKHLSRIWQIFHHHAKEGRGGATKYVLYSKCRRKYYNGNAEENPNLDIFCGTRPQWYFHYDIFFGTCFRVYFLRHLVIRYFLWHYLY